MPKTKEYELEMCECGHEVPLEFTVCDKEGCYTCFDCHIKYLVERLRIKEKNLRSANKKVIKLKAEINDSVFPKRNINLPTYINPIKKSSL